MDTVTVTTWGESVSNALTKATDRIVSGFFPLVGAILIIVVGLIFAAVLRRVVLELLKLIKLEDLSEKVGLNSILRQANIETTVSDALAVLVKWIVIIIALLAASDFLGLQQVSIVLNNILDYIPNVAVAIVILLLGSVLADFIAAIVRGSSSLLGVKTAKSLAGVARYSIIIFAVLVALSQLGIASHFIQTLWTGLVAFAVISFGLAFGLGGKDMASKILDEFHDKYLR